MPTSMETASNIDPYEVFTEYLKTHGMLMTPQRRVLLDLFMQEPKHFSAEEFYDRVKQVDDAIGQATVYRTLKLFKDSGLAETLDLGDNRTRYERSIGREHHDHLICTHCKASIEFKAPEIERMQEELAARHGFVLTDHTLYLYGLCPACREKTTARLHPKAE